jgi:hypothetical protein
MEAVAEAVAKIKRKNVANSFIFRGFNLSVIACPTPFLNAKMGVLR